MPKRPLRPIHYIVRNRFVSILVPLVILLLMQPLVAAGRIPGFSTKIVSLLVILGALRILRQYRLAFWTCIGLLIIGFIAVPSDEMLVGWTAHAIGASATVAAMTIIAIVVAYEAMTEDWVTRDTLLGALVVYLLIGITATFAYELIELGCPGSFPQLRGSTPAQVFAELNYYSLVTLTTLGYGDIAPVNGLARMLGAMEAIIGQFYVAAVLGLLISRRGSQITEKSRVDHSLPPHSRESKES